MSESFESLKSEIIAHLKKLEQEENSNELKKAVAYFSTSESMFSYLEKSAEGKWIEKAGYGVGTVRIWKGKKYKKISTSPVKWVRVFDKMDRGAKNAMTRLVHQAEKIDNPEEMLKFVLANKQRFIDENGKPLDFVDRLNAVIDGKEYSSPKNTETKTDKPANKNIMNIINEPESASDNEIESEQEKHQNRSDAMKGNDNAKPTITFDRNGRLGEKAVNTKLGTDNIKALDALPEKFFDGKRDIMKYPSEVEIDGEKKFAYTNGQFLVVTHDIPANGVKTKQSEKIEGNYPNVEKVIPKEFKDNSAPKVDIDIDQVMKDLPKVDFSKKAFNDGSHKQFMKIGNFWYDAKMVKATYDMLKGDNAEVLESKVPYSNGRFGRICIKTDKGYSVIVSSSNDYAENYKKQSIYNSDEGSMSANAKAEYESRKKTGLPDTYINNAVEFGYQIDNKGFIHGEDKNITFKGKGDNTEFYYNGIPTGIKNRSSYMYGTKENIQTRIDAVKKQIENNIESYKEGKKNPVNKPANYDATFPNMTDKDLTDIYKWWSNPKNIEEAVYKNSYKTKVPGLGSYGNDARKIGVVEDRVMDMLPDIKKEIARRGITIKKSLDGELIFESSLESYVKKSISILKKSLIG